MARYATMEGVDASDQSKLSLTERRKETTRLEISHRAAELFSDAQAESVTADSIAKASGVGLRTFYRYFRTKEDAIAPLLENGVGDWLNLIESTPASVSIGVTLEQAARRSFTELRTSTENVALVRRLLRVVVHDPALLNVWLRVVNDTEIKLISVLETRMRPGTDPLEIQLFAVAANTAQRMAISAWVHGAEPESAENEPVDVAVRCLRILTAGLDTDAHA